MFTPLDPAWTLLCPLDAVPNGRALGVEHDGRPIAVYRDGDTVFVLGGQCPHAGGLMGHGWIEEGLAVCPLHRWSFRLRDGKCQTIRGEWIRTYPSQVHEGHVYARL